MRAEDIECRVGGGGGDSLGGHFRSMGSIPPSLTGGSSVGGSPPGSGQSTPRRIPRSPNREMDRMGVMTLVIHCGLRRVYIYIHSTHHALLSSAGQP